MSVYNGMPYLPEAVRSILNQTYKNFEFIIVDDASTDGTWLYLNSIKDERIKLIRNSKNLGLAASLNIALSKTTGDYIARMDADDISLPNRLKIQINYLLNNAQIDICGSWAKLVDDKGDIIGEIKKPIGDKQIKKMNQWITGIIHPTWLAKRKVFEILKGYNPKYDMVEDYEFLIRAGRFTMANIPKYLFLWRSPLERRSIENIEKMYRKSLKVKLDYFKSGMFGISYTPLIIRSLITTYLFPTQLKIFLNKKAGLIR